MYRTCTYVRGFFCGVFFGLFFVWFGLGFFCKAPRAPPKLEDGALHKYIFVIIIIIIT